MTSRLFRSSTYFTLRLPQPAAKRNPDEDKAAASTITDSKEQVETLGATIRDSKEQVETLGSTNYAIVLPDSKEQVAQKVWEPDDDERWEVLVLGYFWKNGRPKFKYIIIEKEVEYKKDMPIFVNRSKAMM